MRIPSLSKCFLDGSFLTGSIGGGVAIIDSNNDSIQEKIDEIIGDEIEDDGMSNLEIIKGRIIDKVNEINRIKERMEESKVTIKSYENESKFLELQRQQVETGKARFEQENSRLQAAKSRKEKFEKGIEEVKACLQEWASDNNKKNECKGKLKPYLSNGNT